MEVTTPIIEVYSLPITCNGDLVEYVIRPKRLT